jgi:tetratricopeptide (TPR) repeat protein
MYLPGDVQQLLETLGDLGVPQQTLDTAAQVVGGTPADVGHWIELAVHLRTNNEILGALEVYDVALRRFPNHPVLINNRGFVLFDSGQTERALEHFDRAISIKPDYVSALELRGHALEALERFAEAAAQYRDVIVLAPNSSSRSWNSLGACLRHLGDNDEAIACFERSADLDQQFGDPLYNLMKMATDAHQTAHAIAYGRRLLAINPDDREVQDVIAQLEA